MAILSLQILWPALQPWQALRLFQRDKCRQQIEEIVQQQKDFCKRIAVV